MPNQENNGQNHNQPEELLCQAEDLKGLLQQIAVQISDVDKRHSMSLRDMHDRLAVIGARAERVRSVVPSEFQPAFDRIGDAVSLLADRITLADRERVARHDPIAETSSNEIDLVDPKESTANDEHQQQEETLSSQLEQELETLKTTLTQAGDVASAHSTTSVDAPIPAPATNVETETSVACDPADPWNAESATALADLYASGEEGLPPPYTPGASNLSDSDATERGLQANHIDRDWLEARFADVAARVEMSLSDIQEKFSLEELGSRFDQLEDRIAVALEEVVVKPNAEGLYQVEQKLIELTDHLEKTQSQLSRLDSIDDQIGEVVRHISLQGEAVDSDGSAPSETDIHAIAETVALRFASKLADNQPGNDSTQQITGLQNMFEGYMSERREGERNTSGALDTMQSALIHLLERVDAMEVNLENTPTRSPATEPSAGSNQPTPQEYVREAVRFKVDEAPQVEKVVDTTLSADIGRAADEARFMADAAADAAASLTATRGELANGNSAQTGSAANPGATRQSADVLRTSVETESLAGDAQPSRQSNEKADFIAQARRAQKMAGERMEQAELKAKESQDSSSNLRAKLSTSSFTSGEAVAASKKAGKGLPKPLLLACAGLAVVTMASLLYGKFSTNSSHQASQLNRQIVAPRISTKPIGAKSGLKARAAEAIAGSEATSDNGDQQTEEFNRGEVVQPVPNKLSQDSSLMPNQIPANGAPAGITVHNTSRKLSAAALQRILEGQATARASSKIASQGGSLPVPLNAALQPQDGLTVGGIQTGTATSGTDSNRALNMPPALVGPLSLRLAAAKGDPSAEFEVAARFAEGKGIKQNYSEAVTWYQRSAARGFAPAQYRLGTLYERGMGVTTDLSRSRIWYLRAAKQGNIKAMHNLAVLSAGRVAGAPDYASAVQWFTEAGERGLADSQFNLGILYSSGLGVAVDPVQSYKWFSLAAARGDKQAAVRADALRRKLTPAQLTNAKRQVRSWRKTPVERLVNDPHAAGRAWSSTASHTSAG